MEPIRQVSTVQIGNEQKLIVDIDKGTLKMEDGRVFKVTLGGRPIADNPEIRQQVMKIIKKTLKELGEKIDPNNLDKLKINLDKTANRVTYHDVKDGVKTHQIQNPKISRIYNSFKKEDEEDEDNISDFDQVTKEGNIEIRRQRHDQNLEQSGNEKDKRIEINKQFSNERISDDFEF